MGGNVYRMLFFFFRLTGDFFTGHPMCLGKEGANQYHYNLKF